MTNTDTLQLARSGAESVYAYIERTAESTDEGFRWQTLDYNNEYQYNASVFNGVAGISFFLADYYHLTGDERARELAAGACEWSAANAHEGFTRGLCIGRVGVGMACLHLSSLIQDDALVARCVEYAEPLLAEDPGPVTDILGGAAGNGIYLLRLWEQTGKERYLHGAVRNAEWLRDQAIRGSAGVYWPFWIGKPEEEIWYALGFAHGSSGTAHFLLHLYQATQDERWRQLATESLATLTAQARPDHGGLNWPTSLDQEETPRCQWCHGAPGVGLAYVQAAKVLGDVSYQEIAEAAGKATYRYGDVRENPSQCHGLSGNGELFVELYRLTGRSEWLDRAANFAEKAFQYRETGRDGDRWGADEAGFYSPDFMCGAAGTGHFFLRLWAPDQIRMPLF